MQGAIGYAQYFSGLPAGLVWVHVTGSVLIWVTALLLLFALRDRGPVVVTGPAADGQAMANGPAVADAAGAAPGAMPADAPRR